MTIPSWATSMVANYRTAAKLPPAMTDQRIYAIVADCRYDGADEDEILERLAEAPIHQPLL